MGAICAWYPRLMALAGVSHEGVWFMDTYAILAALDAQRLGLDPYAYNPLNYFGGPHVYSHWWLWLGPAGLTRADTAWLGPVVVGIALLAAWWVARPRDSREVRWTLLVLCSAPVVLGFNRANGDLLLFALLSFCVPCILHRFRWVRIAGAPLLIALAMGLKFYPAVAGLVLLAVRPRLDRIAALALAVALLVATGLSIRGDIPRYTSDHLPEGLHTFGAPTAFLGAGLPASLAPWGGLLFLALVGTWFVRQTPMKAWAPPQDLKAEHLMFVLGATLLTGSFLVTVNYGYRWIFALWLVPLLCRLRPDPDQRWLRRLLAATRWLLAVALWTDAFVALGLNLTHHTQAAIDRWVGLAVALQQPLTWLLFACLAGWLANFVVPSSGRLQ